MPDIDEMLFALEWLRADGWGLEESHAAEAVAKTVESMRDRLSSLEEALIDIRNRILCPVGPSPTLDEIQEIASTALSAGDANARTS